MTTIWDSYYVIFLSAILSLGIPVGLALISFVFFPKKRLRKVEANDLYYGSKPNRTILGQRINVRFFLAGNAALILITLALGLIPCVTTLHSDSSTEVLKGLVAIVTIAGFAALGLLYCVRKGDMGWLSSFEVQSENESRKKSDS